MKLKLSNINLKTAIFIVLAILFIDQVSKFYIKLNFELSSYKSNAIVDWGFLNYFLLKTREWQWVPN